MSAALGTLPFLATLWLLVVLGARLLEESGAKIAAALKGDLPSSQAPGYHRRHLRIGMECRTMREPRLRAAA